VAAVRILIQGKVFKSVLGRELSDRPHKEIRWFIALALYSGHFVMLY